MKKIRISNMFLSLFTVLIAAAPLLDIASRSTMTWGESEFPNADEFKC